MVMDNPAGIKEEDLYCDEDIVSPAGLEMDLSGEGPEEDEEEERGTGIHEQTPRDSSQDSSGRQACKTNQYGRSFINGQPLSGDMREIIVRLHDRGVRHSDISRQVKVSHGCVTKILQRYRETGSLHPLTSGGSRPKVSTPEVRYAISYYMRLHPGISIADIRRLLLADNMCHHSNLPSISSVSRIMTRIGNQHSAVTPGDRTKQQEVTELRNFHLRRKRQSEHRKPRSIYSDHQVALMEGLYRRSQYPTQQERKALAENIDIDKQKIQIWFSNRRARDRRLSFSDSLDMSQGMVDIKDEGHDSHDDSEMSNSSLPEICVDENFLTFDGSAVTPESRRIGGPPGGRDSTVPSTVDFHLTETDMIFSKEISPITSQAESVCHRVSPSGELPACRMMSNSPLCHQRTPPSQHFINSSWVGMEQTSPYYSETLQQPLDKCFLTTIMPIDQDVRINTETAMGDKYPGGGRNMSSREHEYIDYNNNISQVNPLYTAETHHQSSALRPSGNVVGSSYLPPTPPLQFDSGFVWDTNLTTRVGANY